MAGIPDSNVVDEETPLLQATSPKPKRTPLPWKQLGLVLFLQLAEPFTSQVISPFAPQLIRDIGITNGDETKVGNYVGFLQSLFWVAQALTVLHWSRLSDRIGRKPIILTGLIGLSASMYCFGLSTTFTGLILSRAMNGALNGNIGVIKSMMAELTDSTNIAQAYAYMPIAWTGGGLLGPIVGGALAHPAERFPNLFGNSEFHKQHPYFLACAVPATFAIVAWFAAFFFLQETVRSPQSISDLFKKKEGKDSAPTLVSAPPLFERDCDVVTTDSVCSADPNPEAEKPVPFRQMLAPRVLIPISNYAFLSLVDIAWRATHPLFLSTPISLGGLGMSPLIIGRLIASFGVCNGIIEMFFFPWVHDTIGPKATFLVGFVSAIPTFALFPAISSSARTTGGVNNTVWALVGLQIVFSSLMSFSFGAIFIFIVSSAPNRASLGATNGLSQMFVSVTRAIGPAAANSLFAASIRNHYMNGNMVYWVLIGISVISIAAGTLLPGGNGNGRQ